MSESSIVEGWVAERMSGIEASGIRKIFERANALTNPINLSIGLPDFDVPQAVKEAACRAIEQGKNTYTVTQGIAELREALLNKVRGELPGQSRDLLVTSGTSGGLLLALSCVVNPGDEVIVFDPYFVIYPNLIRFAGGIPTFIDTYPDFALDVDQVRQKLTKKTKAVIVNSPNNPTGYVAGEAEMRDLAQLYAERNVLLISDEIYRAFTHEKPFVSPARFNDKVLVIDGFAKSHAMTGWRLGFAHGPRRLIEEMIKLQQFSFVCAPSMVQHAGVVACTTDVTGQVSEYRSKRDRVCEGLRDYYDLSGQDGGAFYLFPKAPRPSGSVFVEEAVSRGLLIIPGGVFSQRDTHFRISYAADEATLSRGIELLRQLAR